MQKFVQIVLESLKSSPYYNIDFQLFRLLHVKSAQVSWKLILLERIKKEGHTLISILLHISSFHLEVLV